MDLPTNKKLMQIIYEFEGGEQYVLEGENVDNYRENLHYAEALAATQSYFEGFKPVEWKEQK